MDMDWMEFLMNEECDGNLLTKSFFVIVYILLMSAVLFCTFKVKNKKKQDSELGEDEKDQKKEIQIQLERLA